MSYWNLTGILIVKRRFKISHPNAPHFVNANFLFYKYTLATIFVTSLRPYPSRVSKLRMAPPCKLSHRSHPRCLTAHPRFYRNPDSANDTPSVRFSPKTGESERKPHPHGHFMLLYRSRWRCTRSQRSCDIGGTVIVEEIY
jgi:hypothetical protein